MIYKNVIKLHRARPINYSKYGTVRFLPYVSVSSLMSKGIYILDDFIVIALMV